MPDNTFFGTYKEWPLMRFFDPWESKIIEGEVKTEVKNLPSLVGRGVCMALIGDIGISVHYDKDEKSKNYNVVVFSCSDYICLKSFSLDKAQVVSGICTDGATLFIKDNKEEKYFKVDFKRQEQQ